MRCSRWFAARIAAVVALVPSLGLVTAVPSQGVADNSGDNSQRAVRSDFNGDGYSDLAIGEINQVLVAYGTLNGLKPSRTQLLSDSIFGGPPRVFDVGGWPTLAVGDFDGDGYADLVVGVQRAGIRGASAVYVVHGSPAGLDPGRMQTWTRDSPGVPGPVEEDDGLGIALAAGNFGGSDHSDLAVRMPYDGVLILRGSPVGLTATGSQVWRAGRRGVPGDEYDFSFGQTLAAGHFSGGPYADLALGSPGATVDGEEGAGAVTVLRGSAEGLTTQGSQIWSQNSVGIAGMPEIEEFFGTALAAGRFAGDDHDDLAIGVPGERVAGDERAGAVQVLYGSPTGLRATGSQYWSQHGRAVAGKVAESDGFGATLATGNVGRDRHGRSYDDLVVGSPGNRGSSGIVHVIYGSPQGLSARHIDWVTQHSPDIAGKREGGDTFGRELAVGDFGNNLAENRYADLAVGVPGETSSARKWEGAVNIVYGSASGLTSDGNQMWGRPTLQVSHFDGPALSAR
jgi:hypothetical protein